MNLKFVGKNIELTESLKTQAERKFSKIDKLFTEDVETKITFSTTKGDKTVEATVFLPGTILRVEETSADMYASIDKAVDVLERQVRKHKTRLKKRYNSGNETIRFDNIGNYEPSASDVKDAKLIKKKIFDLRPMDVDEALLQMELLNHNFFVFLDASTDEVSVVYKRKDGNFGQIEVNLE